jgi:glycosyltransferase involved in cell wall biosynthesis
VDLERFQPAAEAPEAARLLFIGSFAHLPNVMAVDFFLREAWPLLQGREGMTLHIIAGSRHRYFLERYRERVAPPLDGPRIEVEDFVSDPRPAYRRATLVVAPLLASAGTNIKIMEAMAMGKAIVSTPGGINGLDDLRSGKDLLVGATGAELAAHILTLIGDRERRRGMEIEARRTVERLYSWNAIGERQRSLYESLMASTA